MTDTQKMSVLQFCRSALEENRNIHVFDLLCHDYSFNSLGGCGICGLSTLKREEVLVKMS
jgi:hypothetical protein